jgi:hypothetical protein
MAPDRNKMADLHEQFLADLTGGRRSRASGATWQDPADGRNNRLTTEFAFAVEGKSTTTGSITVDRKMLAKLREQAGGERPLLGLRWYGTGDLQRIDEEWVAVTAEDFGELLAAARAGTEWYGQQAITPSSSPPPPPPPSAALYGFYPPDLPVPPHELWPCLVVDGRHDPDDPARLRTTGYRIGDNGIVTQYGVGTCRYDTGRGENRLYVNDILVPSGMLFIDGALQIQVGGPLIPQ